MKPMIILPPKQLSEAHIKALQDNGICVVVAKEPDKVRFVDPIPCISSRTEMESAAIEFTKGLLNWPWQEGTTINQTWVAKCYLDKLIGGTSLDVNGTKEQQQKKTNRAGHGRRAMPDRQREEARAEKAAKKAAEKAKTEKKDPSK